MKANLTIICDVRCGLLFTLLFVWIVSKEIVIVCADNVRVAATTHTSKDVHTRGVSKPVNTKNPITNTSKDVHTKGISKPTVNTKNNINNINNNKPRPPPPTPKVKQSPPVEDDGGNRDGSRYLKTFDCSGYPPWELTYNDSVQMTEEFQNWLTYRQNLCYDYRLPASSYVLKVPTYGYTAALQFAGASMINSIQRGEILAPVKQVFAFAYSDATRCSRQVPTIDCFTLPLTTCHPEGSNYLGDPTLYDAAAADMFLANGTNMDICHQGIRSKKPLLWVFGQYFLYNLRLPPTLQLRRDRDTDHIFELMGNSTGSHHHQHKQQLDRNQTQHNHSYHHLSHDAPRMHRLGYHNHNHHDGDKTRCLTAAIQIRTGPCDADRHPFNGVSHLAELTRINQALLQNEGYSKGICSVYVTTGYPGYTVFANLTEGQPAIIPSFSSTITFLLMPRIRGNQREEMELQMGNLKKQPGFDPLDLYTEFLVDVQVMVEADIFLGSDSSFMHVVAGLRYIHAPHLPNNHTCFMGSAVKIRGKKVCPGSEEFKEYWRDRWNHGGVNGGSIFFH